MNQIPNRRSIAQQQRRARENSAATSKWGKKNRKRVKLETANYTQYNLSSQYEYDRHNLGRMNIDCIHCGALHWFDERLTSSSRNHLKFGTCCSHGQVILPLLQDPPLLLRQLFEGQDDLSKEFRCNIRQYNAAHAFTSLGAKIDQSVLNGH
ncbi:15644_t:CDS:1, partial [Gigaspora rosea]